MREPDWIEEPIWDAVVVGAGPAGAFSAHQLSGLGKRVLLLDRDTFPRWKVCGATLSRGIQKLFHDAGLGTLQETWGARPLRSILLGGWEKTAEIPLSGVVALSRLTLDSELIQAATRAGTSFLPGAKVALDGLYPDRRTLVVKTGGRELRISTRLVVAADGLSSGLLAQAGHPSQTIRGGRRPMIGLGGVVSAPGLDYPDGSIHMAMGDGGYVGLVRVEDGSLNVAAAVSPSAMKRAGNPTSLLNSLLQGAGWPEIPEGWALKWKGTPELTRRPAQVGAERILSVGDASGYVEPFTGEGMFWALAGARALAPVAAGVGEQWDPHLLSEWASIHGRLVGRAQRACKTTAWALARPYVAQTALRVLSIHPRLAEPIVRRVGSPIRA